MCFFFFLPKVNADNQKIKSTEQIELSTNNYLYTLSRLAGGGKGRWSLYPVIPIKYLPLFSSFSLEMNSSTNASSYMNSGSKIDASESVLLCFFFNPSMYLLHKKYYHSSTRNNKCKYSPTTLST